MTIAGSDSGGGAGIQADLKTFTALGCYGASVVTALTAQNTKGVQDVHPIPPPFVEQQLQSVLDDIPVAAIKTGMLSTAGVVHTVARALLALRGEQQQPPPPIVIDPVCVSTSGHTLLEPDALGVLVHELLPLATVLTPNMDEAALLLRHLNPPQAPAPISSVGDMLRAACELRCALGDGAAVLLKGGHLPRCRGGGGRLADVEIAGTARYGIGAVECEGVLLRIPGADTDPPDAEILLRAAGAVDVPIVVDVLCERDGGERGKCVCTLFVRPYLESKNTHGTGCTLSAALACALARGEPLVEAVKFATMYTHHGIATAFPIGSGHGPLNHMHPLLSRALNRPTPSDPYPLVSTLIRSNADVWKQYVRHDFVRQLGEGTLERERFLHFIKQDYHYLKYYARANGLLVAKSSAYAGFAAAAEVVLSVVRESEMHVAFSAQWGIDLAELESTPESPACTAYGAYIMDIGMQGDAASLLMALAACLLGYGEVGLWLMREAERPQSWVRIEDNPYRKWIEDYSGEGYQAAVKVGIEQIEALAVHDPPTPKTLEHWKTIWGRCTRLEKGFWDMAMELS
ncbi:Ribokinase-like protein [Lactarius vividus]|nr:Ribokinase-like protein [Lactarius vividus]